MDFLEVLLRYLYLIFVPSIASSLIMTFIGVVLIRSIEKIGLFTDIFSVIITVFNLYLVIYLGAYTYLFEQNIVNSNSTLSSANESIFFKVILHLPLIIILFKVGVQHSNESDYVKFREKWRDAINFNRSLNLFICFSYTFFIFFPKIIYFIFPKILIKIAYCF